MESPITRSQQNWLDGLAIGVIFILSLVLITGYIDTRRRVFA